MKARMDSRTNYWVKELISFGLTLFGGLLVAYMAGSLLDPNRDEKRRKKSNAVLINRRLKRKLDLSPMEQMISDTVVNPDDIDILPEQIYGIDDLYTELLNKAVRPLQLTNIFSTTLWRQTRGLLLYGPPGTGKTMLGKALAKSCGCFFMNVSVSSIMSKWYGDAQKLVRAIFTLAEKLQPCIVFVDEVDSFLTTRGGHSEHEASLSIKTEFMQCWEGMSTRRNTRILVMGTTNRRSAIDPAVLRRFTTQYKIPLPNLEQRIGIMRGYLTKHAQDCGLGPGTFTSDILSDEIRDCEGGMSVLEWLGSKTQGFSGSDLHELCAQAAKTPVIEAFTELHGAEISTEITIDPVYRPCEFNDFVAAFSIAKPALVDQPENDVGRPSAQDLQIYRNSNTFLELAARMIAEEANQERSGGNEGGGSQNKNGSKDGHHSGNSKGPQL